MELLHISKHCKDTEPLRDFTLQVKKGEIHGVLGDRQSGKTTIANILLGLCQPDSGSIMIDGEAIRLGNPRTAAAWGVGGAGETSPYVAGLDVTAHLLLGAEFAPCGRMNRKTAKNRAHALCGQYGIPLDLEELRAEDMTRAEWLWAEILRMVLQEKDMLVLDEPDTVFTSQEMETLSAVLRKLTEDGNSVLLLSRKPETVQAMCDQVTVLGGGPAPRALAKKDISLSGIALETRNLSIWDEISGIPAAKDLSFEARSGEILCLLSASQTGWDAFTAVLTGEKPPVKGRIRLNGKEINRLSVRERIRAGLCVLPRDAARFGIVGGLTMEENLALYRYREDGFQDGGWVKTNHRRNYARGVLEKAGLLEGENEKQYPEELSHDELLRAVLARELDRNPCVLVLQEPTRHMSADMYADFWSQVLSFRAARHAVLLLTDQPEEAMRFADRILVLFEGEIMGEFDPQYTAEQELGWYMRGLRRQHRYGGQAVEGEDE